MKLNQIVRGIRNGKLKGPASVTITGIRKKFFLGYFNVLVVIAEKGEEGVLFNRSKEPEFHEGVASQEFLDCAREVLLDSGLIKKTLRGRYVLTQLAKSEDYSFDKINLVKTC